MRRSWLAVAALLAAGLLPVAASSSSGDVRAAASPSTGAIRVLRTRQPVKLIAAGGSRIAVATTTEKEGICDRIVVWSPSKKTSPSFKTPACNDSSTGDDIQELALVGKTALWLETGGGNWRELVVYSHTLGTKKTNLVSPMGSYSLSAYQEGDYGPFHFVGNLFGAGNLVVFNSWTACMEVPAGSFDPTCPQAAPGNKPVIVYSDQKLLKVVSGTGVEIVSAPDTQASVPDVSYQLSPTTTAVGPAVVAVDAKHVAVQFPDDSVTIYSAGGAVVRSIPIPSGTFSGFALKGSQLVTIRNGKLELYNVFSGKLVKTISLPDGSLLGGLEKGLVAYVANVDYRIHVLRLSDRKDVTFSPPGPDYLGAQIAAAGLFYTYNNPSGQAPGRVVFVPFATVLKKLG
ncbi:MAG TPA: hypothetical protein VIJ84_04935 [Gaiellaceae bacterium]